MPNGAVVEMIVVELVDQEALEAAVKWALKQMATGAAINAGGDVYKFVKDHLTHHNVKHEHKHAHPSDLPGKKAYYHHKR
ncbi:MAG: hypothetical protein M3O15_00715 [Acidobacteriota bacterium]|nr:hypothetical protein [Acidobacteriota bacterium]